MKLASPAAARRRGFTLIELLIVIAIIAILISLLIPAVYSAQAAAQSLKDKSNLKNIGIGLQAFATNDPQERLCTGAYDYLRDGCPDTYGWVADLVNSGAADAVSLTSPISDIEGSEKLNDLLDETDPTNDGKDGAPAARLNTGFCVNLAAAPAAPAKQVTGNANLVAQMMEDGYTTNYATSWWLVRSGALYQNSKTAARTSPTFFGSATQEFKGLQGTRGPLTRTFISNSEISSATINLVGVAAPGDTDEAILTADIPGKLTGGVRLAESFNDGPAIVASGGGLTLLKGGTSIDAVTAPVIADGGLPNGDTIPAQTDQYLQDTRDWFAWGGTGKQKHVNLLNADGSVIQVKDLNGDGYLNPGFLVSGDEATLASEVGYTDGTVELPPSISFNGAALDIDVISKTSFESTVTAP